MAEHTKLVNVSGENARSQFKKVKTTERLYQEVVRQIEERIGRGELKPGDMLPPERVMAEEFGVSRTVIREATKALELQGLVEVQHGRGVMMARPTPERFTESLLRYVRIQQSPLWALHELRSILEVEIAGLAAERRTDQDLQALQGLIERMNKTIDTPAEYVEHDLEFHLMISRAAHNPLFPLVLEPVMTLMRESRRVGLTARNAPRRSIGAHRRIFAAIRAQDRNGAEAAMREHLEIVAALITEGQAAQTGRPPR